MPYEEYANVFLENSRKTCPPTIIRSTGATFMQDVVNNIIDVDNTALDGHSVSGDMALMIENEVEDNYCWVGSVVRQDNYFYMQHCTLADEGLDVIKVMEYNKETNTHIEATVCSFRSGIYGGGGHVRICLVGNRRILVISDHATEYLGVTPNRYYTSTVYSVDFSSGTGVVDTEFTYNNSYEMTSGSTPPEHYTQDVECVIGVKIGEDEWGFVIGNEWFTWDWGDGDITYRYGAVVYYKNFSTGSAWGQKYLSTEVEPIRDVGIEAWMTCNAVVAGKEKIIISLYVYPWGTGVPSRGLELWIFDLNTQELTRSGISDHLGGEETIIAYDASSGLVYFLDYGPDDEDYYCLNAYNPETGVWTENIWGDEDDTWGLYSYLLASKDHVYIYTDRGKRMLRANGYEQPELLGIIPTEGEYGWDSCYFCFAVDSYGPSVILYDCNLDSPSQWYLRHIGVDGTIHWQFTAEELGLTQWRAYIVHMVDCYAILESPFVNGHWLYYLLT